MAEIPIQEGMFVPEAAIESKAVRASGPGGQNVNKLSTKIQMWVRLDLIVGLRPDQLARVRVFLRSRLDSDGRLLVSSQETRFQARNREDVASKVAELIRAALVVPKFRRKTKPSFGSKQRRLEEKRHRSNQIRDRHVGD